MELIELVKILDLIELGELSTNYHSVISGTSWVLYQYHDFELVKLSTKNHSGICGNGGVELVELVELVDLSLLATIKFLCPPSSHFLILIHWVYLVALCELGARALVQPVFKTLLSYLQKAVTTTVVRNCA